jgi:hypothetical protein
MTSVVSDQPDRHFLLIAVWRSGVPTAPELAAVRKLFPDTAMQPPAQLRERVTADGRWSAGVCPHRQRKPGRGRFLSATLHWTGATTVLVIRTLVAGPGQ